MKVDFNGQSYNLRTLVSLAGFGRQEVVQKTNIFVVDGSTYKCKIPVCTIYDGKTYLLAGELPVNKTDVQVSILTKHVLKKALVSSQAFQPDTGFRPRPLFAPGEGEVIGVEEMRAIAMSRLNASQHLNKRNGAHADSFVNRRPVKTHADQFYHHVDDGHRTNGGSPQIIDKTRLALSILEATISRGF
jgi:hypothetical protein